MSKLVVALLVVGCSKPVSGPAISGPPATAPVSAPQALEKPIAEGCPYGLLDGFAWSREVYRGCPPPPFLDAPVTCEYGCPMPCGITYVDAQGATYEMIDQATYDDRNRMTRWRIGNDHLTTATYDGARLVKWEQTGSQSRTFDYDKLGRLVQSTGELTGVDMRYLYDARGNVIEIQDKGLGESNLSYDSQGRLSEVDLGNVGTREYAYDARGRLATVKRNGKPDLEYVREPATGLLTKVTSAVMKETIELTYNARRWPLSVTKQRTHSVTNQLVTERWTYQYDCR